MSVAYRNSPRTLVPRRVDPRSRCRRRPRAVGGCDRSCGSRSAASWTASTIFPYPVQRQMLPESASRISASDGSGLRAGGRGRDDEARRAEAALHRAGVDERALHRMHCSPSARSSTVRTSRPSAAPARTRQAHTSLPSIQNEHDPHSPCSQAFLLPQRPSPSRSTVSRLSCSRASASRSPPLTWQLRPHALVHTRARARARPSPRRRAVGTPPCRAGRRSAVPTRRRDGRTSPAPRHSAFRAPPCASSSARAKNSSASVATQDRRPARSEARPRHDAARARPPVPARDRDHHRVARADLHERLRSAPPASSQSAPTTTSSARRTFFFGPVMNSVNFTRRSPAFDLKTDGASSAAQHRQRVAGGRARRDVPAQRPRVADLR